MSSEFGAVGGGEATGGSLRTDPQVVILMSTFNGVDFVAEQINSILNQTHSRFVLHIRDDGSTDGTASEIEAFSSDKRVFVEYGERIGISLSFSNLLQKAMYADAILYSDQDDIWDPCRVERAVHHLAGLTGPALYGGAFRLFGIDRGPSRVFEVGGKLGLGNALIQNRFPGCVSAFNRALLNLLLQNPCPAELFHDHWAYLLASAKGELVVDPTVVVHKRVHCANATPQPGTAQLMVRVKQFRSSRTNQTIFDLPAIALSQIDSFGDPELIVQNFLTGSGLHRRFRLIVSRKFWRVSLREDLLYRASLCTRRFHRNDSEK